MTTEEEIKRLREEISELREQRELDEYKIDKITDALQKAWMALEVAVNTKLHPLHFDGCAEDETCSCPRYQFVKQAHSQAQALSKK